MTLGTRPKPAKVVPLPEQQELPLATTPEMDDTQLTSISERLKETAIGCRLSKSRMSQSKAVDKDKTTEAAAALGGQAKSISASKMLVSSSHPAIKRVNACFNRINAYWEANTLPLARTIEGDTVQPGVRLMRRDRVESFREQFGIYQAELKDAVASLNKAMPEIKAEAKERLGARLYHAEDYPPDVTPLFAVAYSLVAVEPPSYLAKLDKVGYEIECAKVANQMKATVQLAQRVFLEEFQGQLDHICDVLDGVREIKARKTGKVLEVKGDEELGWVLTIEYQDSGETKKEVQKVPSGFALSIKAGDAVTERTKIGASLEGKPKVFKDSTVGHLINSVAYFNQLGSLMGCSAEVEKLVKQTETLLKRGLGKGVEGGTGELTPSLTKVIVEKVKKPGQFRDEVQRSFQNLRQKLEASTVVRPRRKLLPVKRGGHG